VKLTKKRKSEMHHNTSDAILWMYP